MDYDPLALWNEECEIVGTVYENPEMINKVPGSFTHSFL